MEQKSHSRWPPGAIRDAIIEVLGKGKGTMATRDIHVEVEKALGAPVPSSSIRSYLQLGTKSSPPHFTRPQRGHYRLRQKK